MFQGTAQIAFKYLNHCMHTWEMTWIAWIHEALSDLYTAAFAQWPWWHKVHCLIKLKFILLSKLNHWCSTTVWNVTTSISVCLGMDKITVFIYQHWIIYTFTITLGPGCVKLGLYLLLTTHIRFIQTVNNVMCAHGAVPKLIVGAV